MTQLSTQTANQPAKRSKKRDYNAISPLWNTIFNIVIGIFSFSCIFPFLFVIIISLTDEQTLVLKASGCCRVSSVRRRTNIFLKREASCCPHSA